MGHIIEKLCLVFYNYDILLVWVIELIEIYRDFLQNYQNNTIYYIFTIKLHQ